MAFIVAPKTEGESKECPECKVKLVGRLTDYKGRFPDKLQWQTETERKAHYDKDGNCKGETPKTSQPPTVDEFLEKRQAEINETSQNQDETLQKLIVQSYKDESVIDIYSEIDKLIALEHMIKLKFEERGIELNAQKIGMYMKLVRGCD